MNTAAGSSEPPWLLLPPSIDGSGRLAYKFHRVAEKEEEFSCTNKMDFPADIDITKDVDFAGSSHGWLALFNRRNYDLYLSNPITDRRIQLPPLPVPRPRTFGGVGVVERVSLSSSPDQKSCQSFMTIEGRAALCSPRCSSEWTLFPGDREYDDLVYSSTHGRLFCVTSGSAELECWDTSDEASPRLDWVIQDDRKLDFGGANELSFHWPTLCVFKQNCDKVNYVVCDEHSGDLFLVVRHVNSRAGPYKITMVNRVVISEFGGRHYVKDPYKTVDFDVFKIDFKSGEVMRVERSLCGLAMFVGGNHSLAIPAKKVPGLKPDCIYFTDEIRLVGPTRRVRVNYGGHDNGIFDFPNKEISCYSAFYPIEFDKIRKVLPLPLWFTPTTH